VRLGIACSATVRCRDRPSPPAPRHPGPLPRARVSTSRDWTRDSPRDAGLSPPESFLAAMAPFAAELEELRPATVVLDAHTHLGLDEDGRSLSLSGLLALLDQAGVERAFVFPLHDPDRRPAYRIPNDRVLEWARESEGRLTPFCRLDPAEDPVAEGERALDAGAQGIKLHPRAQAFTFDAPASDGIFALAAERSVPILIHMGRGMPPVAEGLIRVAHRHPGARLILAHGGIADQSVLAAGLRDHPGVYYDTSCFSALDVMELFARVPAERVVFGSDPPYGRPLGGLYLALRAARAVGCDADGLAAVAGETAAALVDGGDPPAARPPVAPRERRVPGVLLRLQSYITIAVGAAFAARGDLAAEMLSLGVATCRDPDAEGEVGEALARLEPALETAAALLRTPETMWFGVGLMHLSGTLAATTLAG